MCGIIVHISNLDFSCHSFQVVQIYIILWLEQGKIFQFQINHQRALLTRWHVKLQNFVALARWCSWLEYCPIRQKVVGLISGLGMSRKHLIHVSLPHQCVFFPLSLFPPSFLSQLNKHVIGKVFLKNYRTLFFCFEHL